MSNKPVFLVYLFFKHRFVHFIFILKRPLKILIRLVYFDVISQMKIIFRKMINKSVINNLHYYFLDFKQNSFLEIKKRKFYTNNYLL